MRIHVVPQTQGALTPRAAQLAGGARALGALAAEVLGVLATEITLDPTRDPAKVDGIADRAALVRNRAAQLAALEAPAAKVLTIGGDCAVELAPIGVARFRHGAGLGVAYFDAHPDLNTAETSPSGAYHGMVLRSLFGEGDPEFAASPALEPGRAVLVGTRSIDPAEQEAIDSGLATTATPAELPERLRDSGADRVYLHLDLDVLDPAEFAGLNYPEPDGLSVPELVAAIRALGEFEVVGAAVTECVTDDRDELRKLVPVLEAIRDVLVRPSDPR
ncbi:arginase family protein [Amycolatopsis sp. 195334CR]|uniref:arginase family protein n=1 Tax=Amycolatopsis sp. 195334CR TaxID=2814588 RepID=UPI001A8CC4C8|nr:arginase family protein [Amycolatopsis sp. 195334CR]MBN6037203.1 arginase family protein [Amycolatopsis sp. 195334CR]